MDQGRQRLSLPLHDIALETQTSYLVSVNATPRSQSDRNATGKCVAYSTYQPGFVLLRWFVYSDSQPSPC